MANVFPETEDPEEPGLDQADDGLGHGDNPLRVSVSCKRGGGPVRAQKSVAGMRLLTYCSIVNDATKWSLNVRTAAAGSGAVAVARRGSVV
jgi:hypothetical protein